METPPQVSHLCQSVSSLAFWLRKVSTWPLSQSVQNWLETASRATEHSLFRNGVLTFVLLGEDDVAKLLKDVGVAADKENLKVLIEKLQGKQIHELVAAGLTKFASIPSGGAAAPSSASAAPAKAAAKVEEKKPDPEPEVDVDMGDLFGY